MKKTLLILSIITILFLVGCNSTKDANDNLLENNTSQQIVENNSTDSSEENDNQQITADDDSQVPNQENYSIPDYLEFVSSSTFNEYVISKYEGPNDVSLIIIQAPDNSIVFHQTGLKQQTRIENNKIFLSSYDEPAGYVEGAIGEFNYYRVDYEIIEKDGKFEQKQIKVDYEDIVFTAQT